VQRKKNVSEQKLMTIGQVAKLSGVGVETIRFYEREGVLPKPKRKPSGYRQFDDETVQRIRFIRKVQNVGFSLSEAGNLASSKGVPAAIEQISRRIEELRELQRELRQHHRSRSK